MIKYAFIFLLSFMFVTDASADAAALREARLANIGAIMQLMAGDVSPGTLRLYYAEDIVMQDPITQVSGIDGLSGYFTRQQKMLKSFSHEIHEIIYEGNRVAVTYSVVSDFAFTPFFSTGEIKFDAVTVFGFEENQTLVNFQQDYYDQTVVYEQIPGLRIILKAIRFFTHRMLTQ